MPLEKGIYENLITGELQQAIEQSRHAGLDCRTDKIDEAEAPRVMADYVSQIVMNRVAEIMNGTTAKEKRSEEARRFVNSIVELIATDAAEPQEAIAESQLLTEVLSGVDSKKQKAAGSTTPRPLSGFRVSNLFTGGQSPVSLGNEIERDIASANRISLIVSFLKLSGVNLIYDRLKEFCNVEGHSLRIITTTYCGVTEAKAVEKLASLPNTEIRISYQTDIERLHAKAYIFERESGMDTAYIGSSNLSKSAQTDGLEWNIRVTNVENPHIIKTALAAFDRYWESPNFEDYRAGGRTKFEAEMRKSRIPVAGASGLTPLTLYSILPHQKQLLDKLAMMRANGICRNLIVAATGTGKTVISAFDFKAFADKLHRANRRSAKLLFVAHREEILRQALRTYRNVMGDANFGELWVGNERPAGFDRLFVSVQTFNSQFGGLFGSFPADYYDYIVVDEAHHATADSYRHLFTHFRPKLLVGLTATPERMDEQSLLPDFDNTISAEIRLPKALEEGLLTPFHYYCISDTDTDLRDASLMERGVYVASRIFERLCTPARTKLICDSLDRYINDPHACRALCFCADKQHARYTAEGLAKAGLKAKCLTTDNNHERLQLNRELARGEINYLCVVDMFNEGVDIPEVDTVLFLRPTESLTIFLQQLGRGLRLAPGKQVLTVLDYVAQLNANYDYASRFRALLTRTDRSVREQLTTGFSLLPPGCFVHLEEKAQKLVLENIKNAVYTRKRLVDSLREQAVCPTLAQFVDEIDQDIRLLYRSGSCWTSIKRDAGKCAYATDSVTALLEKGIGSLVHINTPSLLRFIDRIMQAEGDTSDVTADEQPYLLMLYFNLFGKKPADIGATSAAEAIGWLKRYPLFTGEIRELIAYLRSHLEHQTAPLADVLSPTLAEGMPAKLEQYGCYTREEVFILFDRQSETKTMQGSVSGVFRINELNAELLFVTLNKSDKDFSPTTQYDDYVISKDRFHWQSQNTDSHTGNGERFVNQATNGKRFLLFVRESKRDGFGNTSPFVCFGLVDYVSSHGDRPMNITWQLRQPILPQFLPAV